MTMQQIAVYNKSFVLTSGVYKKKRDLIRYNRYKKSGQITNP